MNMIVTCTTDQALSRTDSPQCEQLQALLQWPAQDTSLSNEGYESLRGIKIAGQLSSIDYGILC